MFGGGAKLGKRLERGLRGLGGRRVETFSIGGGEGRRGDKFRGWKGGRLIADED
jgi:hypothetical protein